MAGTSNSIMEDLFSYNNLVHAVAGATGSVVGMSTFYPLDIVRTRFQGINILTVLHLAMNNEVIPNY